MNTVTVNKWLKPGWLITFSLILVIACNSYRSNLEPRQRRAEIADIEHRDINIVLVETSASSNLFKEGVKLAVEELNENGGILEGREFIPEYYDDKGDTAIGQVMARKIAQNLDVVAVIGHRYSDVAIPVSITYEKNGIGFISTGSTDPNLTAHKASYVFRNIPTDKYIGYQLANFASENDLNRMFIIFERESYGKRLAEFFKEKAESEDVNVKIIAIRSYHKKQTDFRSLLLDAQELDFNAILVAGGIKSATRLIKQTRSLGITQPFIGGDSLDNPVLWDKVGYAAVGTFAASVFNPRQNRQSKIFVDNFKKKYKGKKPDAKAAQGYDAVKILARAIENSKSTVPIDIAMALKYMKGWTGVVGSYKFLPNRGDITGRNIHIKRLSADGNFKFINESK